jgi:hypothetical protein
MWSGGVQALKLYHVGVADGTQADVDAIADLTVKIYDKFVSRMRKWVVSHFGQCVFSRRTPLQWESGGDASLH